MRWMIKYILLLSIFNIIPLFSLHASQIYLVKITADSLNVRAIPNNSSDIVGSFKKGQTVIVSRSENGWLIVKHGQKVGYIDSRYTILVKVVSFGVYEKEKCNADTAEVTLETVNVKLNCEKNIILDDFKSCEAVFDINFHSDCDNKLKAYIDCEAEFEHKREDSFYKYHYKKTCGY